MANRSIARAKGKREKTHTNTLATFLHRLSHADIPQADVAAAKKLLLDYLGYAARSVGEEPARILRGLAKRMGGTPEATVIAAPERTNCLWACLINGAMGHMTELDDTHRQTSSHIGDAAIPAVLAVGEATRCDGKTALAAIVAGYECGLRAGYAVMRSHYDKGWHPSGTLTSFAAAAAAGKVLGLDVDRLLHALGLAGTQTAGNFAHLGVRGMSKDLNPGKGAFNGVLSALLAKDGFTGSLDAFENPKGFIRLYSDSPHPERLTARLGRPLLLREVAHKIYPGCYHMHSAREATLMIADRHSVAAADVESVEARIFATGAGLVDDPEPWAGRKGLHGPRFSAQFNLALALLAGREGLWASYDEGYVREKLEDRDIRALMKRIMVVHDKALDRLWPANTPAVVEIRTKQGKTHRQRVFLPKGEPENPVSKEEIVRKFDVCAARAWPRARRRRIIEAVDHLEDIRNLSQFTRLLAA